MKSIIFKVVMFSLMTVNAMAGGRQIGSASLTCGTDIKIYTQNPIVKLHYSYQKGQMVNGDMDLGEITVVRGNRSVTLEKVEEAERTWGGLGKPKGFGYYSAPGVHLDLRNTVDNYEIFLINEKTGEQIECKAIGDCC